MGFISAKQAADKWGISQRRVAVLCSEDRIVNATMVGNMWIIPDTAEKPEDARTTRYIDTDEKGVKPFLKWAGGKGQLIKEIEKYYPFENGTVTKYAEPFVGGGAVLFDILDKYDLQDVYISDTNAELINAYVIVRDDIDNLIDLLSKYQSEYVPLETEERKAYYLSKRERFNFLCSSGKQSDNTEKAALMIFLNKTCFNGLYRVNKKGLFNVPMGSYKNPLICDERNLRAVSEKLQNVTIVCGDYKDAADFIDDKTFVYFDPPYRPLTETSSFTSYTENCFDDAAQTELAKYIISLAQRGVHVLASNSDPKNTNVNDNFFDDLYSPLTIERITATRMINSNADGRGKINEILVHN